MKVRIKFKKTGIMKFIGHLDVMRYFQKVNRRAGVDIAYSGGFSPHQIMSFASPLGVGLTSEGEYMDIEVGHTDSSKESIRRLNAVMAEGIDVLSYRELPEKSQNAMSSVAAADYTVSFREGMGPALLSADTVGPHPDTDWQNKLLDFYNQPSVFITKKTKKSEREVDLKPHIHELSFPSDDTVFMRLTAGSAENIKPELVMEAFFSSIGQEMKPHALLIHRKDLLANTGTEEQPVYRSLDDFGEDI